MRLGSFWSASFRISSACASRPYAMYTSASAIGSTSSASIPEVWLTDACDAEPGERESPSEGPLPPPVPSTLSEKLAWLDFFRRHDHKAYPRSSTTTAPRPASATWLSRNSSIRLGGGGGGAAFAFGFAGSAFFASGAGGVVLGAGAEALGAGA